MRYLQPFLLLMSRAAVFWIGVTIFACVAFVVAGLAQPDRLITPYVDAVLLAGFAFPASAGWLAGAIIQEFQHCTFAWSLPAAGRHIAAGYLATGIGISLLVAVLASQAPSASLGVGMLFAIGISGYCLSGNLFSLHRRWSSILEVALVVSVLVSTPRLSGLAARHPAPVAGACLAVVLWSVHRLLSRTSFRERPLRNVKPFPGSYSLQRSARYERRKLAAEGPRTTNWRADDLGADIWSWVRATLHETYGSFGWRTIPRALTRIWPLGLLLLTHAWADKGDLSLAEAFGRTVYAALFRSPHARPFGDSGDHTPLVILVVAAAGVAVGLAAPPGLKTDLAYPLSRRDRAAVAFRASLVSNGLLFVVVGATFWTIGQLVGWAIGYPARFDFVPFFLRPLTATVIFLPLAQWLVLRLRIHGHPRSGDAIVAVIVITVAFVAVVWIWTVLLPGLVPIPSLQVLVSLLALLVVAGVCRSLVRGHFTCADLA